MPGRAPCAKLRLMPVGTQPCREELEALVRHYHHVESEHERARHDGRVRHHLEARLREDRERFERLLGAYVRDEGVRRAWRDFLAHRGGEPAGPPAITPLVFKGRSQGGSVVEIRCERSGEFAVEVDGRLVERVAAGDAPIALGRRAVFRLDGTEFSEVFDVPPGALGTLRVFCAAGGDPPWEHTSELLTDGLIDVTFALTARGRRALAE